MKLSPAGYELIKHFEGCSLMAYQDVAGYPTIGYGHKIDSLHGTPITQAQAEDMLTCDVALAEKWVTKLVKQEITQGMFDALVSFVFNLGPKRLADSTLLKLLNSKNYDAAAAELPSWCHAGGKEVPGLLRRRKAERLVWEGEDWR